MQLKTTNFKIDLRKNHQANFKDSQLYIKIQFLYFLQTKSQAHKFSPIPLK